MHILVTGLSHKTAPVEIREALTFPKAEIKDALLNLVSLQNINEGVILSTCNRTEIYTVTRDPDKGQNEVISFLKQYYPKKSGLEKYLYFHEAATAVQHLFRVVSSLDSMVVGEAQILGQAKEAYNWAFEAQTTNVIFNRLFRQAFAVGKRVRTETDIGENAVSISYAAVQLAKKVFEDLSGRSVMVIGAGEMSELTTRHLVANGVNSVVIANRSLSRAEKMAQEFGGRAVPFDQLFDELAKVDIVISSTGASGIILTYDQMRQVMAKRRYRSIFLIDIAVPRDLDPQINSLDNAYLYNIDALEQVVAQNLAERQKEAKEAEKIIKAEVEEFFAWLSSLEVIPTIAELRRKAEQIKEQELSKALSKLNYLSEAEKNVIAALAHSITNKLLHDPVVKVKESTKQRDGYLYVESLRHLFALNNSDEKDTAIKNSLIKPKVSSLKKGTLQAK